LDENRGKTIQICGEQNAMAADAGKLHLSRRSDYQTREYEVLFEQGLPCDGDAWNQQHANHHQ